MSGSKKWVLFPPHILPPGEAWSCRQVRHGCRVVTRLKSVHQIQSPAWSFTLYTEDIMRDRFATEAPVAVSTSIWPCNEDFEKKTSCC